MGLLNPTFIGLMQTTSIPNSEIPVPIKESMMLLFLMDILKSLLLPLLTKSESGMLQIDKNFLEFKSLAYNVIVYSL